MATITSDPSNTPSNWTDTDAWVGGAVPLSTDDVVITGAHVITLTAATTCASLTTTSFGSGTLIQSTQTLTVNGDIAWSDGTFTGGNSAITAETFTLTGGAWTSTSDVFSIEKNGGTTSFTPVSVNQSSPSFAPGTGEVIIRQRKSTGSTVTRYLDFNSAISFYDLTISGGNANVNEKFRYDLTNSTVIPAVTNTFEWASEYAKTVLKSGTIEVSGDIVCDAMGGATPAIDAANNPGEATIKCVGTAAKTYTHTSGILPVLEIAYGVGGSMSVSTTNMYVSGFILTTGDFAAPSGIMSVGGFSGTTPLTTWSIASGAGTFTAGTGEVLIQEKGSKGSALTRNIDFDSAISFYDLTISGGNTNVSESLLYDLTSSTVIPSVTNTFKWAGLYARTRLNAGTIEVSGDLISDNGVTSTGGTTAITLNGTGVQTITETAGLWPAGTWTVTNTDGHVIQATAVDLGAADLTTASDTRWCQESYALATTGDVANSGTIVKTSGGVASPTITSGNAVEVGPCVAVAGGGAWFLAGRTFSFPSKKRRF